MDRPSFALSGELKQAPDAVDVRPVGEPGAKCKHGTANVEDDQHATTKGGEAFLALPVELVELIAANLTRNEQATLRATCRELAAKMQRLFASSFRSMRFLLSDAWSMNALVDISRHPIFSKTLKSIRLAPWSLAETWRDDYDRDRSYKFGNSREIEQVEDLAAREIIWARRKTHRATYERVREEQRQMWVESLWQTTFYEAAVNFGEVGARPTFDFDNELCFECEDTSECEDQSKNRREGELIDCTCPAACGERRIERRVGWNRPLDCVGKDLDSFDAPSVLRTVLAAGSLEYLNLSMSFKTRGTSYLGLSTISQAIARNLTFLSLHREQPRHWPKDWTPNIRTANKLLRAENLPKLFALNLWGWGVGPGERLDLAGLSAFLLRSVATIRDVWITYARKDKAYFEEDSTAMKVYLEGPNSGHQLERFEMLGRPLVKRTASLENGF
ncbi:hypothetical protein LTR10_010600 [Elasticomyces elasticus]|nr:hypothetical protein LTR10_010600 [Elasticomyces elasticus]KAK4968206.1 hypothetical protein LTR42_009489 [Elasticomyces elasticus]